MTDVTTRDRGFALLAALLLLGAVSLVLASTLPIVQAETGVVSAFVERERVRYAAQGALASVVDALRREPSWDAVLAGGRTAPWSLSTSGLPAPDGRPIDLTLERQRLQARASAQAYRGSNTPVWVTYGGAPLDDLLPGPGGRLAPLIAVFVADDGADGDGVPAIDSNDVLVVQAMAFGVRRSRGAAAATVRRVAPAPARLEVVTVTEGY